MIIPTASLAAFMAISISQGPQITEREVVVVMGEDGLHQFVEIDESFETEPTLKQMIDRLMHQGSHDHHQHEVVVERVDEADWMSSPRGPRGKRFQFERHDMGEMLRHLSPDMRRKYEEMMHSMMESRRRNHHQHDMHNEESMMRAHLHFLEEMRHHPQAVMERIDQLPPEMRHEHLELLEALSDDHHHDHHDDHYFQENAEFIHKIQMAREVAARLGDAEAMAIFGVWQVREHLPPAMRVRVLSPIVNDDGVKRSVRNAAAWVLMEAQAESGEEGAGAHTLQQLILQNGMK